jgi:hypothetical protein
VWLNKFLLSENGKWNDSKSNHVMCAYPYLNV